MADSETTATQAEVVPARHGGSAPAGRPRIAYVLTSAMAANILLRGQFAALRNAGFEVTIFAAPGPHLDEVARREGVLTVAVPLAREADPVADFLALLSLWRWMLKLRPALVNAGTPKAGLLGGLAASLAFVPCRLYTLHGLRLETEHGAQRRILALCERIACWSAQRVICVSESVRQGAVELGLVREEKTLIIASGSANGVDPTRFANTRERRFDAADLRRELHIDPETPVLGYVGRLTCDKGIEELLAAFTRVRETLPDLHLLLVGDFEDGDPLPARDRERIENSKVIRWTGFVKDPSLYYEVMDVVALPTRREGFPTVVLEAHAGGRPVVAFDVTGTRDAIEHDNDGLLVPAGNVDALTTALRSLFADPARQREFGENGRRKVQARFNPQTIWDSLSGLYHVMMLGRTDLSADRLGAIDMKDFRPPRRMYRGAKRAFDFSFATTLLLVTAPVLALATVAIRLTMGSPALFRQARPGLFEDPITVLKLRTMNEARDAEGNTLPDADRLTALGRFLRRTSIDELPQLWNVIRGEMSLVGPRPLLAKYLDRYTPRQRRRHLVVPGITGWAQIHGRNSTDWDERLNRDIWYAENANFRLDMRILWRTAFLALRQRGVSQPGHATMPEYEGSQGD